LAIPINGAHSTHILKPDDKERLFGSVQNEALCMTLARLCGLEVAPVTTGRVGDRSYLLVTRYDRVRRDGRWLRIHQEDFCQALGIPPLAKYERNQSGVPGPGLRHLFSVVGQSASNRLRLLDAVIFNVLICNTDSHAKNYSLLLRSSGPELAPLYDLSCADCWNVTRNMAQSIADKTRGDHIHGYHWQRMADQCKLNRQGIISRVGMLSRMSLAKLNDAVAEVEAMPGGGHRRLSEFKDAIAARCRQVEKNLTRIERDPRAGDEPST
jgi:serine/threonine-protein kinase HipA